MQLSALVVRRQMDSLFGGPASGTRYVMSKACPDCGTGAEQSGPLLLRRFRPPNHRIFLTLDHEVLVGASLADEMRNAGVGSLGPVVDAASGAEVEVSQLLPLAVLPPFDPSSGGVERDSPCPACKRDGYYGSPSEPYALRYPDLDPKFKDRDLLATHERFGASRLREPFRDSVFATPVLVAGGRLLEFLNGAALEEVELHVVQVAWAAG